MEQLLNDLQNVLDQLKAAAAPVEPTVDPLRSVVEPQLLAEGWTKPAAVVNVPVTVETSETPADETPAEDTNEVSEG
jgi:hypothetical protein